MASVVIYYKENRSAEVVFSNVSEDFAKAFCGRDDARDPDGEWFCGWMKMSFPVLEALAPGTIRNCLGRIRSDMRWENETVDN